MFASFVPDGVLGPPHLAQLLFGFQIDHTAQWEESFSKHLWFAIVIVFGLKFAGFLAVQW